MARASPAEGTAGTQGLGLERVWRAQETGRGGGQVSEVVTDYATMLARSRLCSEWEVHWRVWGGEASSVLEGKLQPKFLGDSFFPFRKLEIVMKYG